MDTLSKRDARASVGRASSKRQAARTAPLAAPHDEETHAFLTELGQRVRNVRAVRGMSRKVLARVSGVSERYIAQLESGLGNVSIMLLRRVAKATATPLEDFVSDPTAQPEDWPLMRSLLREAPPAVTDEIKDLLTGQRPARRLPPRIAVDRVALIGLRGAGKSTLGRRAAGEMGWPFIELNKEIENVAGFSMTEIHSLYGQEGYRRLEQTALRQVIDRPGPMIVATGGGIVADPMTFELLLSSFFTIWVKTSPAEHMNRVRQQGDLRPMSNDKAAMSELVTILSSREPLYGKARMVIDTSGATEETSLRKLLDVLRSYCAAGCPWQSRNLRHT